MPGGAEQAIALAEQRLGPVTGVVHAVGMSARRFGDGPPSECRDEGWAEVERKVYGALLGGPAG